MKNKRAVSRTIGRKLLSPLISILLSTLPALIVVVVVVGSKLSVVGVDSMDSMYNLNSFPRTISITAVRYHSYQEQCSINKKVDRGR